MVTVAAVCMTVQMAGAAVPADEITKGQGSLNLGAAASEDPEGAAADGNENPVGAAADEKKNPEETAAEKKAGPEGAAADEKENPEKTAAEKKADAEGAAADEKKNPEEAAAEKKADAEGAAAKEEENPAESSAEKEADPEEAAGEEKDDVIGLATVQKITAEPAASGGSFRVTITGLSELAPADAVIVPVWCAPDQSDIYWYTAKNQDGVYVVNGSVGNHKFHSGHYTVDVYVRDAEGNMSFQGRAAMEIQADGVAMTMTDNHAGQAGREQTEYTGRLAASAVPDGITKVMAAVWSDKGGQDDLKWYTMKQQADGSYTFSLNIRDHKTTGQYYVDVYGVTADGKFVFLAGCRDVVIDEVKFNASVTTEDIRGDAGTFRVRIRDLKSVSGVESVTVPVWTAQGGQDDLKWYQAKQDTDGSYVATVNAANHKNRSGQYLIDVYATSGNGIFAFAGGTRLDFKLEDNAILVSGGVNDVNRTISIRNPSMTPVTFAVWSVAGSQKDLTWVSAQDQGNGIWSASVNCSRFLNDGLYAVHAYSGNTCIKTGDFTWNANAAKSKLNSNQAMFDLAQGFSSDTEYLILVNRGLHRVAIYQGSQGNWTEIKYWPCVVGKPSTPTPTGTFKIKGHFSWFGEGHKCWWATQIEGYYYFHSVIYYWDDAPRQILDGTMDAAASMGCVRLDEPNAYWIWTQIPRGTTVHIYN